jgi:hypothetical protein
MSEQDLTRSIIESVNASGLAHVWRNHPGMVKVRRAWMHLAPKGSADIIGYLLDGSARLVGLEVKLPKEKPTELQDEWRARVLAAGGVAAIVRSVAEALDVLRAASRRAA